MTWKEFVEWVKEQGVEDDDEIQYIDVSDPDPKRLDCFIETIGKSKVERRFSIAQ